MIVDERSTAGEKPEVLDAFDRLTDPGAVAHAGLAL
jgi:hypothetical protein